MSTQTLVISFTSGTYRLIWWYPWRSWMKGVNYGRLLTVGTTSMDFTNPQLVRNIVLLATKITWPINRYVTIMSITKKKTWHILSIKVYTFPIQTFYSPHFNSPFYTICRYSHAHSSLQNTTYIILETSYLAHTAMHYHQVGKVPATP